MQNFDFANDDSDTCDIGLQNSSDIEVEFDWDEALENFELENLEAEKKEDHARPFKTPPVCIYQRLKNISRQEKFFNPRILPNQRPTSHLVEKLVQSENFNMVVVTLYPCNKGYTVGFCTTEGQIFQETRYSYNQDLFLDYIDKQELPPTFLDHWQQTFPQVFYSGSVIVKIKDLRYTQEPHIRHVLLKPHTQSILNDANLLVLDPNEFWSMEDKVLVESTIINTVQNPLCLDPHIRAGLRRFHSHYYNNLLNIPTIRNAVHCNSQLTVNKKRRAEDLSVKPIRMHNKLLNNFIAKKKKIRSEKSAPSFKYLDEFVSCKSEESEFKGVEQLARPLVWNQECEADFTAKHDQRLRIGASNYQINNDLFISNSEYVGTVYVGKELNETDNNGSKCSFTIGSKSASFFGEYVNNVEHFTDLFSKEKDGRPVRITHIVPGQTTREACTNAAFVSTAKAQTAQPTIRIQANGKTFMQIGPNTTIGNIQQCSFKSSAKISLQQFQSQSVSGVNIISPILPEERARTGGSLPVFTLDMPQIPVPEDSDGGKTMTADCTSEGTQFTSNNAVISRIAKTALTNLSATINRSVVSKQKIVPRKMTITNSKIRPGLSNATTATLKIPISSNSSNQLGQEQVLTRSEVGLHSTINVSAISQNIQTVNTTSLKGFKASVLRNVANVHTVTGTLESATNLQTTVAIPTVHLIAGPKEKTVTSNGQTTTSSLSLSLPGLSALLADSPITNSQLLKKTSNSLEPSS